MCAPTDLAAIPIKALIDRNPGVDWDEVTTSSSAAPTRPARTIAILPAWQGSSRGLPHGSGGVTLNRLCGLGNGRRHHGRPGSCAAATRIC
jgi:hypothetical protein